MIGPVFVFGCLLVTCAVAFRRPAVGMIGFYGFLLLDPKWNWRWALPQDVPFQKLIFASALVGFAISGFHVRHLSRRTKWALVCMVAFLGLCWLSTQRSFSPEHSQFFMSVVWKQLLVVAVTICLIDDLKLLKLLLIVVVLAQGYNALQINLEYFQTGFSRYAHRSWGSFGVDNNGYSIMTTPILGCTLALALFEKQALMRCLYFGVALLQVHQLMLLESRGCMLAAVVMCGILAWKMPRRSGNVGWVAAAVVIAGLLAGPSVVKEFASSFESNGLRDTSAQSRFYLWKAGWQITKDYPLLGVGPNAGRVLVPTYYEGGLDVTNKALHNLFFDVSTGVGIPGFVCYFLVFALPAIYAVRTYDPDDEATGPLRLAVLAGLPGYLIASIFSSGLLFESCYVLVIVGCCCSNIDETIDDEAADEAVEFGDVHSADVVADVGSSFETDRDQQRQFV